MTPDDIRTAAITAAKLQGCTCDADADTPTGPIRPGDVIHLDVYHADNCPLIRARARRFN